MSEDKPHRVIYKHGTRRFTRVFPTLAKAQEFANSVKLEEIQLASVDPGSLNSKLPMAFKVTVKNDCACGKKKLIADQYCFDCNGGPETIRKGQPTEWCKK